MQDLDSLKNAIDLILDFHPEKDLERKLKNLLFSLQNSANSTQFSSTEEILVPIPNFPNYAASSFGRIFSYKTNKYLKIDVIKNGYAQVSLSHKGKVQKSLVHRLIAKTFRLENFSEGLVVNHKDGQKLNNHINNLEWVSNSFNQLHRYKMGGKK